MMVKALRRLGACTALTIACAASAAAQQDLRNVFPEERPPAVSPRPDAAEAPVADAAGGPARPGERMVLERLRGLIVVPSLADVPEARRPGVDLSRQPLLGDAVAERLAPFIGAPASLESLNRAATIVAERLRAQGYPFTMVYMPQQPIIDDTVVIVARPAALDAVRVTGAEWFSAEDYRAGLGLSPGQPIEGRRVEEGVGFLNRNPFRDTQIVAEPGAAPGTTALVLEARDRVPFRPFAGMDDTGTDATGNRRVFAGFDWGKPFGLADLMTYQFKADPALDHSRAHSLSYTHFRPGGADVTAFAAYSLSDPRIVQPFDNRGRSWQAGVTWTLPLASATDGLSHGLRLGGDVKSSRNALAFGGTETTDTTTHVVQGRLGYAGSFAHGGGVSSFSGTLVASPGGLLGRNDDADFDAARANANARYAYAQVSASRRQPLGEGVVLGLSVDGQAATTNLLGSEQMAGGGYAAVRGYPENEAYGDHGLLASLTLGLPALPVVSALVAEAPRDSLRPYLFVDAARLWVADDPSGADERADLASVGIGFDYAFDRYVSGRFSLGVPLVEGPRTRPGQERAHFALTVAY